MCSKDYELLLNSASQIVGCPVGLVRVRRRDVMPLRLARRAAEVEGVLVVLSCARLLLTYYLIPRHLCVSRRCSTSLDRRQARQSITHQL